MTRQEEISILRLERNYAFSQYRYWTRQLLVTTNQKEIPRLRTERNVSADHYVEVVEHIRNCKGD